jgi:hypothetical protein
MVLRLRLDSKNSSSPNFGLAFFYVIDHQHGRWAPPLLQFQSQLFADGIE